MSQELTETPIAEYRPTEAALADLRARYDAVVYDVATTKGMTEAKKARAELRDLRVSLEKTRKEIKEPALTRCRQIDSEAKRITAALGAWVVPRGTTYCDTRDSSLPTQVDWEYPEPEAKISVYTLRQEKPE